MLRRSCKPSVYWCFTRSSASLTVLANCSLLMGFTRMAEAPRARISSSDIRSLKPVQMITGKSLRMQRSSLVRSTPFVPGMVMSVITRSNLSGPDRKKLQSLHGAVAGLDLIPHGFKEIATQAPR